MVPFSFILQPYYFSVEIYLFYQYFSTKETKLIILAGVWPLPPLLHPAWPLEDVWIANDR